MTKPDIWTAPGPEAWVEPTSIDDALTRRDALLERVKGIDVQLGDRDKRVAGERVDKKEYFAWRTKALWARRHLEADAAKLKAWVRERRAKAVSGNLGGDEKLLAEALRVMKELVRDYRGFTAEQQEVKDAIEARLGLR